MPVWWAECTHARAVGMQDRRETTGTRKVSVDLVSLLEAGRKEGGDDIHWFDVKELVAWFSRIAPRFS